MSQRTRPDRRQPPRPDYVWRSTARRPENPGLPGQVRAALRPASGDDYRPGLVRIIDPKDGVTVLRTIDPFKQPAPSMGPRRLSAARGLSAGRRGRRK